MIVSKLQLFSSSNAYNPSGVPKRMWLGSLEMHAGFQECISVLSLIGCSEQV